MKHTGQTSKLLRTLAEARFLSFSLFIHLLIGLALGGIVLFKVANREEVFLGAEVGSFLAEEESVVVDEVESTEEFTDPASSPEVPSAPVLNASAITSLASSPASFQITATEYVASAGTQLGKLSAQPISHGKGAIGSRVPAMGSLFGTRGATTGGLVGVFYDLKQTRNGEAGEMSDTNSTLPLPQRDALYRSTVGKFLENWNPDVFANFYRAPEPLSTHQFFIPRISALEAPKAFAVENQVQPRRWVIHYKGTFLSPQRGKFRFCGVGDDILVVRLDGKVVFDGSLNSVSQVKRQVVGTGIAANGPIYAGEWFQLSSNKTYPLEVLLGEQPGGSFYSFLMIEKDREDYKERPQGTGKILPVFRTKVSDLPDYQSEVTGPTVDAAGFLK